MFSRPERHALLCILAIALSSSLVRAQSGDVDGIVVAAYDAELSFPIAGPVSEVLIAAGEPVQEGQPLVRLEDRAARAAAAAAKLAADSDVALRLAQARLQAAKRAGSDAAIAELKVEQATLDRQRARVELEHAVALLDQHTLQAPVQGFVARVYVSPGEHVAPGDRVLRLVREHPLFIEASIPSDKARTLEPNAKVMAGQLGAAELVYLSPTIDPETDARFARFRLLETDETTDVAVGSRVGITLTPPPADPAPSGTSRGPGERSQPSGEASAP